MDWDEVYFELKKRNWITLLVLSSISYFLFSSALTLGVIAGGLIVIINFSLFQHTLRKAFSSENHGKVKKSIILIKGFLRLLAMGIVLYLLIVTLCVHPIGLAFGLSTVVISIVSFGITNAAKLMIRGTV
jgi:hypothetical protein